MDTNQTRFTANNMSWNNLEMSMEDQILHDQLPLSPLWQSYPPQAQQTTSQSGQKPVLSAFVGDQMGNGNQHHLDDEEEEPEEELGAMKEMMFKIAAMQPVDIDPSTIRKPKRRNVRISDDPQSVAARHRRERISEKIRILQRLVPGGTKMDTASMLEEAIRYVKFLKRQIRLLQTTNRQNQQQQQQEPSPPPPCIGVGSSDWPQFTYNSKPLVGTNSTSSSLDHQPQCSSHGLIAFGGNGRETICFNHEVISD